MAKKKSLFKKIFYTALAVMLVVGFILFAIAWFYIWAPNTGIKENKQFIYIKTGWKFNDVVAYLSKEKIIKHPDAFVWLAKRKNYQNRIFPGRYLINKNMSNEELVNLLRSGMQVPVKVTFSNVRLRNDLAAQLDLQLEPDSAAFMQHFNNEKLISEAGFDTATFISLFIPNTYEFYWTSTPMQFIDRMKREYKQFWNNARVSKAEALGLSKTEVTIIASVVQQETNMEADKPIVAGVYINRINNSIPLEADPTLKFAIGDFTRKRLLNADKESDSPYNTYKYRGLPPGPICMPNVSSIDAVLNYAKHQYLFFCAREDFSGYSNFAVTYNEHLVNARKYQAELNRRKIMK